jgi:hypothetical protein
VIDVGVVDQVQRVAQHVLSENSKHFANKPRREEKVVQRLLSKLVKTSEDR